MRKNVIGWLVAATSLLLGSNYCPVSAQSQIMDQYCMSDPQTWAMVKYSGQTPDLYTGTVRAEIPIYTYTDPDFEIPVSLTYASNGYIPNTQANFVGLGWSLNAGGCITRRVQGVRDEIGNQKSVSGYYDYVVSKYPANVGYDVNPDYEDGIYCYRPDSSAPHYETEPDIFIFSFLGYNGKFVISPSGDAVVFDSSVPGGEITVDLSGFNQDWPNSTITLKTGNGYEYVFGGLGNFVGNTSPLYTYVYTSGSTNDRQSNNMDNYDSWYLKEIHAPNGRTVSYSYHINDDTTIRTIEPGASYSLIASANIGVDNSGSILTRLDQSMSASSFSSAAWFVDRTRNLTLPSSIDIDGRFEISFTYTTRTKEKGLLYGNIVSELATPLKLSSIIVTDKVSDTQLLDAFFEYKYPSSEGNQVLMLSKVSVSGLGSYQMEYYNENEVFPYLGSCAVDHWGYYNSSTSKDAHSMVPNVELDENYIETITSSSRNPDSGKALTGMLKSIKYPTGGYTKYKYESHGYGKIVERNSQTRGRFSLRTLDSEAVAGGLRVKEVLDSASSDVVSRRIYEYLMEDGKSSGIMMEFPRYCMCAVKDTVINDKAIFEYYNIQSSSCPGYLLDGCYIGYSSVKEIYGDGSSKITRFTSWEEYPDILDDNDQLSSTPEIDLIHIDFTYPKHYYNIIRIPTSASSLRGKVLSVSHYDSDGILLETDNMEYDAEWENLAYLKSVKVAADSIYIHHTLCDTPLLKSDNVVYPDGGFKKKQYEYNPQDQLRSRSIQDCDNSTHITYCLYPQDIPLSDRTEVEQEMVDKNIISDPVFVVETHKKGNVERIVSSLKTMFKSVDTGDDMIYVKESENIADITTDMQDVTSFATLQDQVRSLTYKPLFTWNEYNILGRPCHVTDIEGVSSVILWGYQGLYPLALLENVTPSMFDSTVHASGAYKGVLGWGGISSGNETVFRKISGSAVTVWDWKPFVGMTRKTGPDGRTTSYSYDQFGRLETVVGPDGNIDTKYVYHIK